MSESVGIGAGFDDVAAEREPIHDRRAKSRVGERFRPTIWGWHLFVSVETRSSLGLQHVFAF